MDTVPTSDPQREQRPAGQLTADRDWIIPPDSPHIALVLGVFKWPLWLGRVAVAYQDCSGTIGMFSVPADRPVPLATADEAAQVQAGWRREGYAAAFEQFAQLIRCQDFPLPEDGEPFRATVRYPNREPVAALAGQLGLPVDTEAGQVTTTWPASNADGERPALQVLMLAWDRPPQPRRPAPKDWVRAEQEPGRDDEPGLETTQVLVPVNNGGGYPLGAGAYRVGRVAAAP
jgi:hypothetical protein